MSRAVVEAEFHRNPKVTNTPSGTYLSLAARGAWTTTLSWCADKLSDGRLSRAAVRTQPTLKPLADAPETLAELVTAGFLEIATDFDGWYVHDYLDHNASAAEVKAAREANARRVAKHREKRKAESVCNSLPDGSQPLLTPNVAARAAMAANDGDNTAVVNIAERRSFESIGAEWWFELTTRRDDFTSWRSAYAAIGAKPAHERAAVAKHWRETPYINERPDPTQPSQTFFPDHAIKFWEAFKVGPRILTAKPLAWARPAPGMPTAKADIETAAETNPEWIEGAAQ